VERWGKRRLAYRVKKFEDGIYYLLYYEAPSPVVQELERRIRIEDKLLRFLTVAVDWDRKIIPVAEAPAEAPVAEDRAGVAEGPVADQLAGEEVAGAEDAMSTGDYVT
jgi:small subunit ribosomal protein S6